MKPQKDMKQTLRYKSLVADLRSRSADEKGAALLKAIAGGSQWRMDAVLDVLDENLRNWGYINAGDVFKQAAMFGRLATLERIAHNGYFNLSADNYREEIVKAFDTAVIHGHYKVADFCKSLGASPEYLVDRRPQRAMPLAVEAGDIRKMDYLIEAGADPSQYLNQAVCNDDRKTLDYLLSKGGDVNYAQENFWTPLLTAVQYENSAMVNYLLSIGAETKPSPTTVEMMFTAMMRNNTEIAATLLNHGVKPRIEDIRHAEADKHPEMVALLSKYLLPPAPPAPSGPNGP